MVTLENAIIKATIHPRGAELHSLYHKDNNINYLWDGNSQYWNRRSPVLFPIVGGLKEDCFLYKGEKYTLPRHGFARDMVFEKEATFGDCASFILKSNDETKKSYPFDFLLRLKYQLNGNKITVYYEVENHSDDVMPFSIGAHPAFNVPLVKNTTYKDYYLQFEEDETSDRLTVDNNLINGSTPFLENQSRLDLTEELFYKDALVFKNLKSSRISLCSDKTSHGLHYDFKGFNYMGIWAAKNAPFVCIEPWCGIADFASHNQQLEEKEGIIKLEAGEKWHKNWSLTCL